MEFSVILHSVHQFGVLLWFRIVALKDMLVFSAEASIDDEKSAIWATLITDVITVTAALGALALPVSLNVIEATRSRYRSPSFLKVASSISGVDAKSINRQLFLILAVSVIAKLYISLRVSELIFLVPYLCVLTIWFGWIVFKVYKHLKFTYDFMSSVENVQERIYRVVERYSRLGFLEAGTAKWSFFGARKKVVKFILSRVAIHDHISAFVELESYLLCADGSRVDLDDRFKSISYKAFHHLEIDEANEFARHLLAVLPSVLAAVEDSREVDVYQRVAGFYLHLAMGAMLSKDEYRTQIGVIERIGRFREEKLPSYGRFCRTGRLFVSFANKSMVGKDAYTYLQKHFNSLIDNAVREQPANIPILLDNIRQVIQFKGNYNGGAWDIPGEVPELWGYSSLPEFDRDVREVYAGRLGIAALDKKVESKYKPEMREFIEREVSGEAAVLEKVAAIDAALDKCWKGVALNEFSSDVEVVTLRALAMLLSNHPEIFIECRELRNPAGSKAYNIGHSPVPTSIGECVIAFVSTKNYADFFAARNELQEYQVVDAIGALIVYELWDAFILRAAGSTEKQKVSSQFISSCHIGELRDAVKRTALLEVSLMKTLANVRFVNRLGIMPDQVFRLQKYASEFCKSLECAIKKKEEEQVASQVLDAGVMERFKEEVAEELGVNLKHYDAFRRVVLGFVEPIVSNISLPREAFLSGTNTYFVFEMYGANFAVEINNWLNAQILLRSPLVGDAEETLPNHKAERIICSSDALKKFLSVGFTISGRRIIWPDGRYSMQYLEVMCAGSAYYVVFPWESLLIVNPKCWERGVPVSMSFVENGGNVDVKIECHVGVKY